MWVCTTVDTCLGQHFRRDPVGAEAWIRKLNRETFEKCIPDQQQVHGDKVGASLALLRIVKKDNVANMTYDIK